MKETTLKQLLEDLLGLRREVTEDRNQGGGRQSAVDPAIAGAGMVAGKRDLLAD